MAKLTLIGLNNYTDGKIWDGLTTPSGFNKTTFINTIMLNYGEMETLYADPDMMAFAIKTWSDRNSWSMLKAITAINIQYEPLNNYDRHETRTLNAEESGTNTGTVQSSGTNTGTVQNSGTNTGTVKDAGTSSSNVSTTTNAVTDREETNETEHKVSAYDSSTYSPDNTDDGSSTYDETVDTTGTSTASGTTGNTRTDNLSHSETRTDNLAHDDTRTDNLAHENEKEENETIRAWGNIGVTTSQQMLKAELDLSLYNMYDTFAGVFAFDLLVMTY